MKPVIRGKNIILLLSALMILEGCGRTVGTPIEKDVVTQIKSGVTTKTGILEMLGEPFSKNIVGDNEEWMYYYAFAKGTPTAGLFIPYVGPYVGDVKSKGTSQRLNISFDKNIVTSCVYMVTFSKTGSIHEVGTPQVTTITTRCGDEEKK